MSFHVLPPINLKVISGGQTGADLAGLWAAKWYGIPTGGTAPKWFKTLKGSKPALNELFGVTESSSPNYQVRTLKNVQDSHFTLVFAEHFDSPGTKLTLKYCRQEEKPAICFHRFSSNTDDITFQAIDQMMALLRTPVLLNGEVIINVAGNATANSSGIFRMTFLRCIYLFNLMASRGMIDGPVARPISDSAAADQLLDNYSVDALERL